MVCSYVFLVNSWYQPHRRFKHPPSYSSSAATYTACEQTPAAHHASPNTFVHKDLRNTTHVFLRQDVIRRALEPPYSGPHKVITRTDKTLTIVGRGREVKVSADRVKPAYNLDENQRESSSPPAQFCTAHQNLNHRANF
jgi:hypothetical protein